MLASPSGPAHRLITFPNSTGIRRTRPPDRLPTLHQPTTVGAPQKHPGVIKNTTRSLRGGSESTLALDLMATARWQARQCPPARALTCHMNRPPPSLLLLPFRITPSRQHSRISGAGPACNFTRPLHPWRWCSPAQRGRALPAKETPEEQVTSCVSPNEAYLCGLVSNHLPRGCCKEHGRERARQHGHSLPFRHHLTLDGNLMVCMWRWIWHRAHGQHQQAQQHASTLLRTLKASVLSSARVQQSKGR